MSSKKSVFKIMTVLVCLCMGTSVFVSCGKKNDGNGFNAENITFEGVHEFAATETEEYLVKDGKTDYLLVVPSNTSALLNYAKDEFVSLFKTATGITLLISKDDGLTHSAESKYISLGDTELFRTSGLTVDKAALSKDGVRIQTKDNTVYLSGGSDYGVINAVYDFMKVTFNYEYFYDDCVAIDGNVGEKKLFNYNVTDIPDMKERKGGWIGQLRITDMSYKFRLASSDSEDVVLPVYTDYDSTKKAGSSVHTTDKLLPKETYQSEHPKWYTTITTEGGKQLCYTARGDEAEFEAMAREMAKKIEFSLSLNTPENKPYITSCIIGMEDTYDSCACPECVKLKDYYGTECAAACIFVNRVGELVETWMNDPENEKYKREDFHIMILAYNNFIDAPVKFDEKTGKYVPVDEKVVLRSNVGVYYTDIKQDYQSSLFGEVNAKTRKNLQGWAALTNRMDHYVYVINYQNRLVPYDTFNYFSSGLYRYYMNIGSRGYYICNFGGSYGSGFEANWSKLKLYYHSNLLWNSNLDGEELFDKWFEAMFADAAEPMRRLFDEQRIHMAKICSENQLYKPDSIYIDFDKADYFPRNTLRSWMDRCDDAVKAIEKYKTSDYDYYLTLLNHIESEYISPAWEYLYLYKDELLDEEKYEIKDRILGALDLIGLDDMYVRTESRTVRSTIEQI